MSVRRVMGTETEFGISVTGQPLANPMVASSRVVNAYAGSTLRARRARWDFEEESPLRDARGFDMSRQVADPSQLTDEDLGLANVILTNGARLYVDHAHPEYSTPECTNPRDIVIWDKAGEQVGLDACRFASTPGEGDLVLYKNNTDNKGASYGSHENYLMRRSTPFADIVRHLTPFFVSRQVMCGAGRVGIGQDGRKDGFQISQRSDYFEVEVGLETTLKRPIINTRDEPHADPEKYRRLHVIVGDANRCEVAQFLKMGTTAIVLKMIEDGFLPDFSLVEPVSAIHAVSRDLDLATEIELTDGRRMTAVQLQSEYLELARKYVDREDDTPTNREVIQRWESVIDGLVADPMSLVGQLDWAAKLRVLEGYRERDGLSWGDPKLRAVDLQYHDVRRGKGLYDRLVATGKVERLVTDEEIEHAVMEPPEDTRAFFRGRCISRYPDAIAAASWDSVILDAGRETLQRVPMREPLKGTRAHVEELLEAAPTASDLVDRLQA